MCWQIIARSGCGHHLLMDIFIFLSIYLLCKNFYFGISYTVIFCKLELSFHFVSVSYRYVMIVYCYFYNL